MSFQSCTATALLLALSCGAAIAETPPASEAGPIAKSATAFLAQHCTKCHNADVHKADFRLDGIRPPAESPSDLERWEKALEMVRLGDMPPKEALQPAKEQRDQFVDWLSGELESLGRAPDAFELAFPKYANRVDHDDLFSGKYKGPAYTRARVWRINAHIYLQLVEDLDLGGEFVPPLGKLSGEGFDDYSLLYADESTIGTMLQNGKRVAMSLVHGRLVTPAGAAARDPDSKPYRVSTRHRVLNEFAKLEGTPSREQMDDVVRYAFNLLFRREPENNELERYVLKNLEPNVRSGGPDAGLRGMLLSMLLSPEFLFRMEMGLGEKLPDGRRMLSPHELAYALSFALHDHPVPETLQAADEGRLRSRDDVEREVRRLLDSDRLYRGREPAARRGKSFWPVGKLSTTEAAKPRMLRFFREFFDYPKAVDVFKDDLRHGGLHDPRQIVSDADWLVLSVLAKDRDVLAELLTTDRFFVAYGQEKRARNLGYGQVYNLTEPGWSTDDAVPMPAGQRAGILTHPAWLVAHSGNFETDPVRRGKWIQTHLLAGAVPDIPIGVEAQLPEAPHQTIRERFEVVRKEECWRCHKKMNPLGEPFEIYDDFGRFRRRHHVTNDGIVLASDLELNRNNRELQAQPQREVDAGGTLSGTGDPQLDGDATDAIDLVHRLAKSERVRQSFLRHVFRYWMGRNETLDDSPTLLAMDEAYVNSGGSFKETLFVLLTSDSFLYRK